MTTHDIESYLDRILRIGCGMDCRSMLPDDLAAAVAVFREALEGESES